MAKIEIFALGGLGEDGKNMYCLDIDEKIFIFDAGLKYPARELYGVDVVLPDFRYLAENKTRIVALFLSHGHEDHIGAVPALLKQIDMPVYASAFTIALLKDAMKEQGMAVETHTLKEVSNRSELTFGDVRISFYQTTHSIPESYGIVATTADGAIVYSPDYTFDQNVEAAYKTNFKRLASIASKNVLALLGESLGAERQGHSHSGKNLEFTLNQAFFKAEKRVVVSTFSTDLFRIQRVIDVALKYDRSIALIGRRAQRMVDIALRLGYLKIPKEKLTTLKFIDDKNKNLLEDALILVTGDRHEPFYMLQRMVRKLDRLIHLNESDTVILMTPPVPGTERIAARTLDVLYRNDIKVVEIDKGVLPPAHAASEDIKLLMSILNPQHIIPVIGEHRHLFAMKKIATGMGYPPERIHLLDNGEVLTFLDGEALPKTRTIGSGDVLVDGILEGDLNEVVLRDRELLSQDGLLLIVANIDAKAKMILGDVDVISRGFVYMRESEALMEEVAERTSRLIEAAMSQSHLDWRRLRDHLRDDISRFLHNRTKRRPIVMPVLIDTEK